MPQFEPSVQKTAVAPITVAPAGLNCEAELFLGPNDATPVASSGIRTFLSTGSPQQVSFPVKMPASPGTYHVYVDVHAGGQLILAYIGAEDVLVLVPTMLASLWGIINEYISYLIPVGSVMANIEVRLYRTDIVTDYLPLIFDRSENEWISTLLFWFKHYSLAEVRRNVMHAYIPDGIARSDASGIYTIKDIPLASSPQANWLVWFDYGGSHESAELITLNAGVNRKDIVLVDMSDWE